MSNIFFTCDVVDITDGIFHDIHNRFLASGGTYEIPFNNYYYSFSSTSSSLTNTTKFSLSTQSLNRVWGMITTGALAPITTTSANVAGISKAFASSAGST